MTCAERIDALRALLRIDPGEEEAVLQFCLASAKEQILSYCNIKKMPAALEMTRIRIAADIYRAEGYGDAAEMDVSSMQEGDQSVHYTRNRYNRQEKAKDFTTNYASVLSRYRRLEW